MKENINYVAGFMFSPDRATVALIRKSKPEWQRGKLNGIGGKVEYLEKPIEAIVREFREETGRDTTIESWTHYLQMRGPDWAVNFYHATGDLLALRSLEEEKVELIIVDTIRLVCGDCIENLPWLISLAIDNATDGRPSFVSVDYP